MKPWQKNVLMWGVIPLALMAMISFITKSVKASSQPTTTSPTNVTPQPSGPQFDVWMDGTTHTISKEYYTGVITGSGMSLSMKGTIPEGYIDNWFSWSKTTGKGLWKAEFHPNKGPGQRAHGTTEVGLNADGKTFTLRLLDPSGKEYGTGTIVPRLN